MTKQLMSILALCTLAGAAGAQSTTLTYQGRLDDAGASANGPFDLRFRLFDALSGGAQMGPTVCSENVEVTNGLFTVQIDFGQQFATAAQRFLQIDARPDTGLSCASATGYVTLTPRQLLTAAPLASHAKSAFALHAADGSPQNAVFVSNDGKVGMGTVTPAVPLHLIAPNVGTVPGEGIRIQGTLSTGANQAYLSFANGAGTAIGYVGDGGGGENNVYLGAYGADIGLVNSTFGTALIAKSNGNIGIGTTSPANKLHLSKTGGIGTAGGPAIILQDTGVNSAQSGYVGFWNSSGAETAWVGYGTPGSAHFSMVNARAGGNIQLVPGAGGVVSVPILQITGADLAEKFPTSDTVEPGMVVAIDRENAGKLCKARGAYNRCVAGVVSGANDFSAGAVLGNLPGNESAPAIALSGRVYVWCDAADGPIEPGDLLTSSSTPGHAMKATDRDRSHGAVIGKAMEPLESGRGLVLVLVNLQ